MNSRSDALLCFILAPQQLNLGISSLSRSTPHFGFRFVFQTTQSTVPTTLIQIDGTQTTLETRLVGIIILVEPSVE